MNNGKETQVVMLEAINNLSGIWLSKEDGLILFRSPGAPVGYKPQHLYFLSNEEIKEGDYKYDSKLNIIIKHGNYIDGCKKVIATTNPELAKRTGKLFKDESGNTTAIDYNYLPRPSDSFIQKYVEEYNKGNVIDKVLVEYAPIYFASNPFVDSDYRLKVAPDNTITIKPIAETTYTESEVLELLSKFGIYCTCSHCDDPEIHDIHVGNNIVYMKKWLKDNHNPSTKIK